MRLNMIKKAAVLLAGFLFVHCGAPDPRDTGDTGDTGDTRDTGDTAGVAALAQPLTATSSFLYTVTNGSSNAIAAYRRDASTGAIGSLVGLYGTGGAGSGDLLVSQSGLITDGRYLFVVNPGSNTISSLAIGSTGALSRVSTVDSGGTFPVSLILRGSQLLVLNQGTAARAPSLTGFTVAAGGLLTATGLRTALTFGNIPTHIVLNPSGSLLILLVPQPAGTGHMVSYAVSYDTSGNIARLTKRYDFTGLPGPFAGVFSPRAAASNQLLVVDENLPGAISFVVGTSGTLTVNNSAVSRQRFPCWIVVNAAGTSAFTTNTGADTLSLFAVASDGKMTLRSNVGAAGHLPTDLTLDPAGRYLYEVNVGSASVKGWRLTGATTSAGLAAVNATAAADLPADAAPFGVVVVDK